MSYPSYGVGHLARHIALAKALRRSQGERANQEEHLGWGKDKHKPP
jgi:hypothetical protein